MGVYVGSSAILECNLEAYPRPTVYWKKDDQMPPIIHSDQKHEITLIDGNTSYRFILRLRIVNVHKSDIGKYTCMAKNTYGEEKSVVQVYEIERRVVPTQKAVQSLSKSIFMDLFTTKDPVPQAKPPETKPQQTKVTHKGKFYLCLHCHHHHHQHCLLFSLPLYIWKKNTKFVPVFQWPTTLI